MRAGRAVAGRTFSVVALAALVAGCARGPAEPADTIYSGGAIVTMNDEQPVAEALAVKDGRILAVGPRAAIERSHRGRDTRSVDLAGHALLPGFIDSHSRFIESLTVADSAGGDASGSPLSGLDPAQELERARAGQMAYARAGITTAQAGELGAGELALLKRVAGADASLIDIVAFPSIAELESLLVSHPAGDWGEYRHRLKLGGVSMTLDGAPEARAAWFIEPYAGSGPNGAKPWRGKPAVPEAEVRKQVRRVFELELPLQVEASGDAAIEVYLRAHEAASGRDRGKDRRVTLVHATFASRDQLEKMHQYMVTPSFCSRQVHDSGDLHVVNRGAEAAAFVSPMRAALAMTMHPTVHTDFADAPLDPMLTLWAAVNRVTRSGALLGGDQRVSPLDALKSMTLHGAMQYGEQERKGSLEPGKLADLVILERNPLEGDRMTIRDIRVLETVKEGKTIFKRP